MSTTEKQRIKVSSCKSRALSDKPLMRVVLNKDRTPVEVPQVGDFVCRKCGKRLRARAESHRHLCSAPSDQLPQYQKQRLKQCEGCDQRQYDPDVPGNYVCAEFKRLHPDQPCGIQHGVKVEYAACPLGKWTRIMIRCPECTRKILTGEKVTSCRYCGWRDQAMDRPTLKPIERTSIDDALVVTATDQRFIRGAYFLAWTLLRSNGVRMLVYTNEVKSNDPHVRQMKSWGVEFAPIPMDHSPRVFFYMTWNKPAAISDALSRSPRVLWLDSDTAVAGSLAPVFSAIDHQPFASGHVSDTNNQPNATCVTDVLGAPRRLFSGAHYPCAGVIGFKSGRDQELINEWRLRCATAVKHPEWSAKQRSSASERSAPLQFYDQGVLMDLWEWDTHDGKRWSDFAIPRGRSLQDSLTDLYDSNQRVIAHYGGRNKPFFKWPKILYLGHPNEDKATNDSVG